MFVEAFRMAGVLQLAPTTRAPRASKPTRIVLVFIFPTDSSSGESNSYVSRMSYNAIRITGRHFTRMHKNKGTIWEEPPC